MILNMCPNVRDCLAIFGAPDVMIMDELTRIQDSGDQVPELLFGQALDRA